MTARWMSIAARHRRFAGLNASVEDFTPGDAIPVAPETVLAHPELSLYCLDHAAGEAVFVELPPAADPVAAPFLHRLQYEAALRLFALPFPDFLRLAAAMPPVGRFVMLYMTGRCGSTLLSHALNRIEGVTSLAEPDAPLELVRLQRQGQLPRDAAALFDASVRFLFRTPENRLPPACVLKLRSEALQIAGLIGTTYPQARSLFLYRDATGFVGSMYRIFNRFGFPERRPRAEAGRELDEVLSLDPDHLLSLLGPAEPQVTNVEFLTVWWLGIIEQYLAAVGGGLEAPAFAFEDITRRPEAVLARARETCGLADLPLRPPQPADAIDSQRGTPLAQEQAGEAHLRLTPAQSERVRAIVARHPVIGAPGFGFAQAMAPG
jgi:hypothetical protein